MNVRGGWGCKQVQTPTGLLAADNSDANSSCHHVGRSLCKMASPVTRSEPYRAWLGFFFLTWWNPKLDVTGTIIGSNAGAGIQWSVLISQKLT